MFNRFALLLLLISGAGHYAAGQDVRVHGHFGSDSVRIGGTIPYSLTVRYPSALNVILADTAFSFAPFEFQKKKYFPTVTKDNISYDSVVYFLTTYEVDSVQTLHLPAFVVHTRDCTRVDSNTDSVLLAQLVRVRTDSLALEKLPLKTNTDYFDVSWLLNYPLLLIIGGILVVILIVLWFVFGKRIIRHYKLKRLARKHAEFVAQFAASVNELQNQFSPTGAESIFVLWKKYMENLVSRPYTRLTSKEILRLEKDESLSQALRTLNMIIYAGIRPDADDPFARLKAYTEGQFLKKTEEVKHG